MRSTHHVEGVGNQGKRMRHDASNDFEKEECNIDHQEGDDATRAGHTHGDGMWGVMMGRSCGVVFWLITVM